MLTRLLGLLQVIALARCQLSLQGQVTHADDGIHGRADLMAHIGEKRRLGRSGRFSLLARLRCVTQGAVQLHIFGFDLAQRTVFFGVKNTCMDQQRKHQPDLTGRKEKTRIFPVELHGQHTTQHADHTIGQHTRGINE